MNQNHIIFRCDGGFKIGMGHIVGSLRLAKILEKELSVIPVFLVKENEKVTDYLKTKRIQYVVIPKESSINAQIESIKKLSGKTGAKILSFNLDADELRLWGDSFSQLKERGFRIIFQDNPMSSFLFGDIVINALPHPKYPGYDPNIHNHCFDGQDYLLFDEAILKYQNRRRKSKKSIDQILIALGGSDHKNITSLILNIMADIQCDAYIDVVMGPASEHMVEVKKIAERLSLNAHVSYNVTDMAKRMWNADIGFSTLGLTTYEMVALRLPCLIIASNPLNAEVAEKYAEEVFSAKYAGYIDRLDYSELKAQIGHFLSDHDFHKEIISKNQVFGDPENYRKIILAINEMMHS